MATMHSPTEAQGGQSRRKKHIDWDRKREEQLVTLIIKYKAHKKTSLTMEEKWGRVSHELFTLDTFRDFVELDGYTLQKKFSRLKRKIASKYQVYSTDFDVNSLPEFADEFERVIVKLVIEGLAEKANGKEKRDKGRRSKGDESEEFEENDEDTANHLLFSTSSVSKAGRPSDSLLSVGNNVSSSLKKRSRNNDSDSENDSLDEVEGTVPASVPHHRGGSSSSLAAAVGVNDDNESEDNNQLVSPEMDMSNNNNNINNGSGGKKTNPLTSSSSNSNNNNNRYRLELLEFEKEKERKRIAHQERLETMKLEYEMKQNLLKLEAEVKAAEAQIKLADAHKAQAEVTAALLQELQRMRAERDEKEKK
jgi:hypothetical protein